MGVHRVPDCLLRNGSHHRLRLHGRAHQLQSLLRLLRSHFAGGLPHLRPLDVGRRLAPEHGLPRLCRFCSSPQRRRRHRHAGRGSAGSPHRQVRQGRQAPRHPRPQPDRRCAGRVHPLVLLVRLQRRLFPEPFHRRDHDPDRPGLLQHQPCGSSFYLRDHALYLEALRQARRLHDAQRLSGWSGGHHRRLRHRFALWCFHHRLRRRHPRGAERRVLR